MMPILTRGEMHNKKIHFWNSLFRAALLTLVIFVAVINFVGVRQVFVVGNRIEDSIAQGKKNREAQTKDTQSYIECIALLTKKYPDFNFQTATYEQAQAKLRECVQDK